jgi:hypothetical protein
MRCRKVRSCLSAFYKDELKSRQRLAVSEHLAECAACRKEAAIHKSICETARELVSPGLSQDFNTRLLNRIAQERFAETRTQAYLPRSAPLFSWGRAIPAVVSACVVILAVMVALTPQGDLDRTADNSRDDAYLTAQPINNPNVTQRLAEEWSLNRQLAHVDRVNSISESVVGNYFGQLAQNGRLASAQATPGIPFAPTYYKVRPVVRVYLTPEAAAAREAVEVY